MGWAVKFYCGKFSVRAQKVVVWDFLCRITRYAFSPCGNPAQPSALKKARYARLDAFWPSASKCRRKGHYP